MNRRLASIGAVLKKDLITLWPLALAATALPLFQLQFGNLHLPGGIPVLAVALVLSALLIIFTVQNDPAASVRHDWLTRPIRRLDMVLAKAILLVATVGLPWLIGHGLMLMRGSEQYPLAEVLLASGGQLAFAVMGLPILAFVCVTGNKIETVVGFVCLFAAGGAYAYVDEGMSRSAAIVMEGRDWPVTGLAILAALAICVLAIWLQYGRRRTWAARSVLLGLFVAAIVPSLVPPSPAQADERGVQTGAVVTVDGPAACEIDKPLARRSAVNSVTRYEPTGYIRVTSAWVDREAKAVGLDPKAVIARGEVHGLPAGWMVSVERLDARLSGAGKTVTPLGGAVLTPVSKSRNLDLDLGPDTLASSWLISKEQAQLARAAGAGFQVDAGLTLMKPVRTAHVPADGKRHRVPGLGYCGVHFHREGPNATPWANCLTVWPTPVQLTFRLEGQPDVCKVDCGTGRAAYSPAGLQVPSAQRWGGPLKAAASAANLIITVFEPAGRIERKIDVSGPLAACPMPGGPPVENGPPP